MATYTKCDSVKLLNSGGGKVGVEEFCHAPESVLVRVAQPLKGEYLTLGFQKRLNHRFNMRSAIIAVLTKCRNLYLAIGDCFSLGGRATDLVFVSDEIGGYER